MSIEQTYIVFRKPLRLPHLVRLVYHLIGLQLQIYYTLGNSKLKKGGGLMLFCPPPPKYVLVFSSLSDMYGFLLSKIYSFRDVIYLCPC